MESGKVIPFSLIVCIIRRWNTGVFNFRWLCDAVPLASSGALSNRLLE
jgi:hypothetical protein